MNGKQDRKSLQHGRIAPEARENPLGRGRGVRRYPQGARRIAVGGTSRFVVRRSRQPLPNTLSGGANVELFTVAEGSNKLISKLNRRFGFLRVVVYRMRRADHFVRGG